MASVRPASVSPRNIFPVVCLGPTLVLSACGGGSGGAGASGGGSDSSGESKQMGPSVTYPTPDANLGGGVSQSTVTGNLTDPDDGTVTFDDVNFIDVNGVMAVQAMDDPGRWSVQVPVSTPDDTLTVTVESSDGTTTSTTQALDNRPLLADPVGVALDAANDRALVTDDDLEALIAVDLASGDRTILSDTNTGTGIGFSDPYGVALDASQNRALVTNADLGALLAVDLASGDRAILSDANTGTGTDFSTPSGVALDAANDRALVTEFDLGALFVVEPGSGERAIASR